MMHVRLCRETNPRDPCAILVKTASGKTLGHLESKVAAFLAPIIDSGLTGLIIKA